MYKEVSRLETQFASQIIGVSVSIKMDRDLTQAEKTEIYNNVDKIVNLLRRNTLFTDEQYLRRLEIEKQEIVSLFPCPIYVKDIPNGYSKDMMNPWFIIVTHKGPIVIGWRKRVLSIDWSQSDIKEGAEELFPNEDVTKYEQLIHAWGYDKAKDYISKLLQS